ncbi:hypothetical protein [Mesorhizobium sp. LNJC394B00]|uniref:hypothetical protein n=1 Tax=Mesorhizobium sp. LNJC394B00 TaxID=1287274 RepID=UPI000A0677B3
MQMLFQIAKALGVSHVDLVMPTEQQGQSYDQPADHRPEDRFDQLRLRLVAFEYSEQVGRLVVALGIVCSRVRAKGQQKLSFYIARRIQTVEFIARDGATRHDSIGLASNLPKLRVGGAVRADRLHQRRRYVLTVRGSRTAMIFRSPAHRGRRMVDKCKRQGA